MLTLKKEEVDKMMKLKGNVIGVILQGHFDYIRDLKGENGVKAVEARLKELGYPLKAENIINVKWYPESIACLITLVSVEVFGWDRKDVFEMAYQAPRYSFVVKLLMQHFLQIEKNFRMAPTYWHKHFDFSEMETAGFSEKEKYGIIMIKDFHKYHPLICVYHQGYFTRITELMLGSKEVKVNHTRCLFKGDPYEEFKITWR